MIFADQLCCSPTCSLRPYGDCSAFPFCVVLVSSMVKADVAWLIATNNLLTVTSTFVLYIAFFLSFLYKYAVTYGYRMTSHEKQMFVQSCAISGANVTLALLYVYMLFFPATFAMTTSALFLWQFSSGE
ncbi:hypothetical protein ANCCAN_29239 [Ancylostoma caninum]|uniref:Uncharacterized protein n=1 Tax=Ancylostoma caninum TaxID=29170 RepID=A0A368EYZ8_ANCCA|nr:hypothetical protein ANCCAN_29239 [Ancylostoma caninum]